MVATRRWVLVTFALSSFLFAPAGADPAEDLVPFDVVGLDPLAPPVPAGLWAVLENETWHVRWDAVTFDGTGLEYVVYTQTVREPGNHEWQATTVDGDTTETEIPATGALVILTVTSRAGGHESAAGEFLTMGPLPIQPHCGVVRAWLRPPPPGAAVSPQCLPPVPPE